MYALASLEESSNGNLLGADNAEKILVSILYNYIAYYLG